jgi:hypothetical protein
MVHQQSKSLTPPAPSSEKWGHLPNFVGEEKKVALRDGGAEMAAERASA